MSKNQAKILAEQIRDEYRIGSNSAERVGNALLAIINAISDIDIESLSKVFLRKDIQDAAQELIGFEKGIEIGQFIDSYINGQGAKIDELGNITAESIKVRGAIESLVLIYNKLSAVKGDQVFSDNGLVDDVVMIDENTYRLYLHKDTEQDFTTFQEGDVVRGSVRAVSSLIGGMFWGRVISVDAVENAILLVTYPNEEVPSKTNLKPTSSMVIHRWGNITDKKRQSTWYLSTTEGRIVYLSDVTKPILEDHNYAAFFGKPIALKVLEGKPINPDQPYLYVRGLFVQDFFEIDYNGAPLIRERDNGLWESGKEYTDGRKKPHLQDAVWHHGVKWKAVVEKATEVPKWNSTHWALAGGDTRIKLEIESSNGWFFYPDQVDTIFSVTVYRGDEDITSMILPEDWQWTRDTGNINADNAWAIKHKNDTHTLHLGNEDVGVDFSSQKRVKFICTVFIRYGEEVLERKVEIKI